MTPLKILNKYFGYSQFRSPQEEIIKTVLNKQDALVLMPTGGGKSLCYQIPALLFDGLTVVVSPLISLMKDQVDALVANGVNAACINSTQRSIEQNNLLNQIYQNKLKIIYIAPERLSENGYFFDFLKKINVSLFAIDEAHCISHWGHDFRPDYLNLGLIKDFFPETPILALTASADQITRKDIVSQLKLKGDNLFVSSFNRKNIFYFVKSKKEMKDFLPKYIRENINSSGIIYCLSRKKTEDTALYLKSIGFSAECYHAGLETEIRTKIQDDFVKDKIKIIVATIAFGMGIDKSNVRFVIHIDVPKNIEGYYQETGRAGRDGLRADAILFYSKSDLVKLRYIIETGEDEAMNEIMIQKLNKMAKFAETNNCRRQYLMQYFNESHSGNCNSCDICLGTFSQFDGTIDAQKVLSAIIRLEQRFGIGIVVELLRGANTMKMTPSMRELPTYGIGSEKSESYWKEIINQLIQQEYITQSESKYPKLVVLPKSYSVLKGDEKVMFYQIKETFKKPKEFETIDYDKQLFEELRKVRIRLANDQGVPPYVVLSDSSLVEICVYYPQSLNEIRKISGFGDYKTEKYGYVFVNAVKEYCSINKKQ